LLENVKWSDDGRSFKTNKLTFECSTTKYDGRTSGRQVALLKDRKFLELYEKILDDQPKRILEIGFFQAGMPLFLADTINPEKIVAIDQVTDIESLNEVIEMCGWSNSIKLYGGVDQGDSEAIRTILNGEFGDEPLDLIIDDCSHTYDLSKSVFEATFGYLKPGGKYILEDWGWAHWNHKLWQSDESPYKRQPALTNLIFESIMALGSAPEIISRVEIPTGYTAIFTRGLNLSFRSSLRLESIYLTGGCRFTPLAP